MSAYGLTACIDGVLVNELPDESIPETEASATEERDSESNSETEESPSENNDGESNSETEESPFEENENESAKECTCSVPYPCVDEDGECSGSGHPNEYPDANAILQHCNVDISAYGFTACIDGVLVNELPGEYIPAAETSGTEENDNGSNSETEESPSEENDGESNSENEQSPSEENENESATGESIPETEASATEENTEESPSEESDGESNSETEESPSEENESEAGKKACCDKPRQDSGFCTMDDLLPESVEPCGKCLYDQQCIGFAEALAEAEPGYATGLVYCCPDAKRCTDLRPTESNPRGIGCPSGAPVAGCGRGRDGACSSRLASDPGYPQICTGCTNEYWYDSWMDDMTCSDGESSPATEESTAEENDNESNSETEESPSDQNDNESASGFWEAILHQHNYYRCLHGVSLMVWDANIAANAQAYADETRGAMQHSSSESRQNIGGFSQLGENLYWTSRSFEDSGVESVAMWYNEIELTESGIGLVTEFSAETGHYTQVVWKSSTALGCGGFNGLIVCQYGPAGNYYGQFIENVLPPTLPDVQCATGENDNNESNSETEDSASEENQNESATADCDPCIADFVDNGGCECMADEQCDMSTVIPESCDEEVCGEDANAACERIMNADLEPIKEEKSTVSVDLSLSGVSEDNWSEIEAALKQSLARIYNVLAEKLTLVLQALGARRALQERTVTATIETENEEAAESLAQTITDTPADDVMNTVAQDMEAAGFDEIAVTQISEPEVTVVVLEGCDLCAEKSCSGLGSCLSEETDGLVCNTDASFWDHASETETACTSSGDTWCHACDVWEQESKTSDSTEETRSSTVTYVLIIVGVLLLLAIGVFMYKFHQARYSFDKEVEMEKNKGEEAI